VQTDIEEVVQVAHVELQPVHGGVKVSLHTLDYDFRPALFYDFQLPVFCGRHFKKPREYLTEDVS
jgi:hypothetical protein